MMGKMHELFDGSEAQDLDGGWIAFDVANPEGPEMKPTNEFRWLELKCGEIGMNHPTAQIISGTNRAIVLQQKWVEVYAFDDGPVPDGKHEWRDIKVER